MSNKIDGPGPGVQPPSLTRSESASHRRDAGRSGSARSAAPEDSARVKVTDQALKMKRLEDQIMALPDVDNARVDAVREKLARGDYEVNKGGIAEALIRYELESK